LNQKSRAFNLISHWICIYFESQNKKIELINFWAINGIFSFHFLIEFAFILKSQNKKIWSINFWALNHIFQFNFWLYLHLFRKFKIQNSKIESINFWTKNRTFLIQSLIEFACFSKIQNKKIRINQLLNQISHIFKSISDWICIYFEDSKQENRMNQLLRNKLHFFNWIDD
jgi:hypothetical protein